MKRIVVFQHVPYEILGTFNPLIKKAGIAIRYANFGRDPETKVDIEDYDGLVVLGGPMGVYDVENFPHLAHEMECIRKAIDTNKPVFGICLGAQLIAAALGAPVKLGPIKEIGWQKITMTPEGLRDPILSVCKPEEKIFQWHQDYLELPPTGVWLAKSDVCPYQAFRINDNVYGFQFHLEVDSALIERWLNVPSFQSWLTPETVTKIRSESEQYISRSLELSHQVFSRYLDIFCTKQKRTILKSRH